MCLKALYCLLILGVVVCQNGDINPTMEGSGSGEVDGKSTVDATSLTKVVPKIFTKTFTRKPEDTTSEAGSGDDEDGKPYVTLQPNTIRVTMPTRPKWPIDEEGSGAVSGSGVGGEATEAPWPNIFTMIKPDGTQTVPAETATSESMKTTMGNFVPERTTAEAQPTESSRRKGAETKKPLTIASTIETDSVNDVEIINSPTSRPVKSTKAKATESPNDIPEPVEDPRLLGNTAKSKNQINGDSKPAISFTTGIIIGVVVGALLAVIVILLLVYRLRKKDEGSYALDEPITGYTKQEPGSPVSEKEYFA